MSPRPLKPGKRLKNRYVIVRQLRTTTTGYIYEARDPIQPDANQLRTIKETPLDDDRLTDSATLNGFPTRYRFLTELYHPTLLRTYDYFVHDGYAYQVTEFIRGRDLEAILLNGDDLPPIDAVYHWALALTDVLDYLHQHPAGPIIYRDLKPANVMIDQRLQARLIDLDIAGVFAEERTANPLGTDGYAAPEQYEGVVNPRVDIYGLGATLHHLLTGTDPRFEAPFSLSEVPIRSLNPQVSEGFERAVMRALRPQPELRFHSAASMRAALKAVHPEARIAQ